MGKASKNKKTVESVETAEVQGVEEEKATAPASAEPRGKKKKTAAKAPKGRAKKVIAEPLQEEPAREELMLPQGSEEAMLPAGDPAEENLDPLSPEERNRHAAQVEKLALSLFTQLEKLHQLGEKWERRLTLAARLHDIGWQKGGKRHHKTGMEMVEKNDLGISPLDRDFVALLVRYHRKAWPSRKQRKFAVLGAQDQLAVTKLASLLRIADGLDFTHASDVESVTATVEKRKHGKGRVDIVVKGKGDLGADISRGQKKGDLFENVFSVTLHVMPAPAE